MVDMVEKTTTTYKKIAGKDKARRLKDAIFRDFFKPMIEPIIEDMEAMQKKIDDPNSIENLITSRETQIFEKKSSLRWSYREGKKDKVLESVIMKTIAGFNNSEGGTLVIGVDDEGKPLGLDNDYSTLQKGDNDGFATHLITIIDNNFGLGFSSDLTKNKEWIQFPIIEDKEICAITIPKGVKPRLLIKTDKSGNKSKVLYRRLDAQTNPIEDRDEISKYIAKNFPQYQIDESIFLI